MSDTETAKILAPAIQSIGDGLQAIAAALSPEPIDQRQIILAFLDSLDPARVGAASLEGATLADSPVVAILNVIRSMVP